MGSIGKAVGGLFGGGGGDKAASQASAAQVGETRRQFDITQRNLDPYRQAGINALNMQLALMGLPQVGGAAGGGAMGGAMGGPVDAGGGLVRNIAMASIPSGFRGFGGLVKNAASALGGAGAAGASSAGGFTPQQYTREEALASLQGMPGQEFLRERQQQALLRNAAAIGGLGGGQVRTDLQKQAFGFAQQDLQNQLQRLAALSGGGQNAAAQLGQFGANAAQQIGSARAQGILGAQQANAQQAQQGMNILGTLGSAFLFSDERLKENIENLDLKACFEAVVNMPLKTWNYIAELGLGTDKHFGPIAQEAPDMIRVKDSGIEKLNLHDELMMIAGAIQYMHNEGMLNGS